MKKPVPLSTVNQLDRAGFVAICGPLFEHSPWIAERTWSSRPFESINALHTALVKTMFDAKPEEKEKLIGSHPDLVGKLAREGRLTQESTAEQKAAGLTALTEEEAGLFDHYNSQYRAKFGFPFVICARQNKKDSILAAFPLRLRNEREVEVRTALWEIAKIAQFRLLDAISES